MKTKQSKLACRVLTCIVVAMLIFLAACGKQLNSNQVFTCLFIMVGAGIVDWFIAFNPKFDDVE
jgi:hypothetical protein